MNSDTLVSIIIPCYNAENFITETIRSVLHQTYQNFEIIILNDGSLDNSEAMILAFSDSRIQYIRKDNSGVSDTRNRGLALAQGNFVLFLDADDVLTDNFLESRIQLLLQDDKLAFSCGKVIKIDDLGKPLPGFFRGTYAAVFEDILLYKEEVITCPSNYLVRKSLLDMHQVRYNTELSSTADRFFLIELGVFGKGGYVDRGGELFYRVSQSSMSHQLTLSLVKDNELFFQLLQKKKASIPASVFRQFNFKINYILGAAYLALRQYRQGAIFMFNSFFQDPVTFSARLGRKVLGI